ncbi:hypothetical protein, partial [Xenorhabdus bovienii]|uniref:hypothetical protein n=1 Tax=Xenorhabdus bovienii TaxID=40576 RepID=UPI001E29AEC6
MKTTRSLNLHDNVKSSHLPARYGGRLTTLSRKGFMTVNREDNLHQKTPEVTVLDNRGLTVREL